MPTQNRNAIGFNQPPGSGNLYPFSQPSSDIAELLGDFFLSFEASDIPIVPPLKVAWMSGFGTVSVPNPTGWPDPANDYDLIVQDASGRVVFDSTQDSELRTTVWANRLRILEWTQDTAVCRCTMYTAWSPADIADNQVRLYDQFIVPENGDLQADTWYELPRRVTAIVVNGVRHAKKAIMLQEGYNMTLERVTESDIATFTLPNFSTEIPIQPGTRLSHQISLAAVPGAGLGTVPGCEEVVQDVRTINNVASSLHQNFIYDTDGCIRVHRPVALSSATPRQLIYSSSDPLILSLPNSAAQARATIKTGNDCRNCCDCVYFAQTYQGLKRQWYLFQDVAHAAEGVRDLYTKNRERWLVQKQIRERSRLRVRIAPEGNGKVSWGVVFCNSSTCCLVNVQLQLIFYQIVNGVYRAPSRNQYSCAVSQIEGSRQCHGPEDIIPAEDVGSRGQVVRYNWDYSDPQSTTTLSGRHNIPDARHEVEGAMVVKLWASVTWETATWDPVSGEACLFETYSSSDIDPQLQAFLTSQGVTLPTPLYDLTATPTAPLSSLNSFCFRGNC